MSLKVSLAYGLAQDGIALLKGQKLGYVEFIKRRLGMGAADIDVI